MQRKSTLAWIAWVITYGLALFCAGLVVKGVLRDRRVADPVLALDFSQASGWRSTRFRVWGGGTYTLFVSSVNWDSTHVGSPLGAALEVAVSAPNGRPVFQQTYAPHATGLVLPINYGDSRLADLALRDWPLRRWTLAARVRTPDERFKTAQSSLKLYKQRYDPGMGGMMNYVMIFPGAIFMALSVAAAISLARSGKRIPIVITGITALLLLAFIAT